MVERLIDWHIRTPELIGGLMDNNQYAYMKGRSTESAMHQIVARAEGTLRTREHAIVVFMDIRGAFSDATVQSIEDASHGLSRVAERGCPQGGVLSPLLWNLVVDEVPKKLRNSLPQVYSNGYADDISTLSRGLDLGTVVQDAQRSINIVNRWSQQVDLGVEGDKVAAILLTSKRVGSEALLTSYLGNHIVRATKGMMALAVCKRAIGPTWGLRPSTVMWMYKTIVRPTMEYGAVVWCSASKVKCHMKLLDRVQRVAMLSTSGTMRNTPSASLECLFGLEPMDIRIQRVALSTMYRLQVNNQWLGWYGRGFKGPMSHMDLCNNLSSKVTVCGPGKSDRKKACREWAEKAHKSRWQDTHLCKQTKLFLKEPYQANLGNIVKLNRNSLRQLVQGKETGYHFITECDCFAMTRLVVLEGLYLTSEELLEMPFASDCDLQMMYSDSEDLDSQMSFSVLNMVLTIVFVPPKDRRLIGVRNRYSLDIIKSRVSFCRLSFIFSGRAKENLGNEIYGDDINDDGIENDGNEDDDTEDDDVEDDDIGDDNIEDVDIEGDDVDDDDIKDDDVKDDDVEDDDVEDDDIEDQDDIWERFFKGIRSKIEREVVQCEKTVFIGKSSDVRLEYEFLSRKYTDIKFFRSSQTLEPYPIGILFQHGWKSKIVERFKRVSEAGILTLILKEDLSRPRGKVVNNIYSIRHYKNSRTEAADKIIRIAVAVTELGKK
ncbi:Retrovirus-related Pol polyprotein from type-1 retrotransposable element R1 [Folsomia candida]|uniref:Retrovirus-related Pol polyprotein from type-1 retrotransposable element R1 n=1 Tax=Folsomia candida TaxID=158441 RepID=A0A226DD16_FOLCA|nr:Retrovirus-related Pol polyprotein from type-1 retrotransposable element R1 [Folsomia candida]